MNGICEKLKSTSDLRALIEIEHGFLFIYLFTNTFVEMAVILFQTNYQVYFWKENLLFILIFFLCISLIILILSRFFLSNQDDNNFLENSAGIQLLFIINISILYLCTLFGFIPKYWTLTWLDSYYFVSNMLLPTITLILICFNRASNKR